MLGTDKGEVPSKDVQWAKLLQTYLVCIRSLGTQEKTSW